MARKPTLRQVWRDQGWEALRERMSKGPAATHCRVGLLGSEADAEHSDSGLSVGEIGLLQEFGSRDGHIPQRSFLRRTFNWNKANRREMLGRLSQVSRMVLFRGFTRIGAMKASGIGPWAVDKVQQTINSNVGPANAPQTIKEKGHSLTLRDTFQLMRSISFVIVAGGASVFSGGGNGLETGPAE